MMGRVNLGFYSHINNGQWKLSRTCVTYKNKPHWFFAEAQICLCDPQYGQDKRKRIWDDL